LRLDALGNALFSLKKREENVERKKGRKEAEKLVVSIESYHFESNKDYSEGCSQFLKLMMITILPLLRSKTQNHYFNRK